MRRNTNIALQLIAELKESSTVNVEAELQMIISQRSA